MCLANTHLVCVNYSPLKFFMGYVNVPHMIAGNEFEQYHTAYTQELLAIAGGIAGGEFQGDGLMQSFAEKGYFGEYDPKKPALGIFHELVGNLVRVPLNGRQRFYERLFKEIDLYGAEPRVARYFAGLYDVPWFVAEKKANLHPNAVQNSLNQSLEIQDSVNQFLQAAGRQQIRVEEVRDWKEALVVSRSGSIRRQPHLYAAGVSRQMVPDYMGEQVRWLNFIAWAIVFDLAFPILSRMADEHYWGGGWSDGADVVANIVRDAVEDARMGATWTFVADRMQPNACIKGNAASLVTGVWKKGVWPIGLSDLLVLGDERKLLREDFIVFRIPPD